MPASELVKIEGSSAGWVRIDGTPFQKGTLKVQISGDNVRILGNAGLNDVIVEARNYTKYCDNTGTAYTSLANLQTAIEANFFQV